LQENQMQYRQECQEYPAAVGDGGGQRMHGELAAILRIVVPLTITRQSVGFLDSPVSQSLDNRPLKHGKHPAKTLARIMLYYPQLYLWWS
jgi:hypothetical protein